MKRESWRGFVFAVYAVLMLTVTFIVVFVHRFLDYYLKEETGGYLLGNAVLALLSVGLCALCVLLLKKVGAARVESALARVGGKPVILLSLLTMAMQVFVCYHTYFISSTGDSLSVTESALAMARGEYAYFNQEYFTRNPNNIVLMALYSYILRLVMTIMKIEPGFERFTVMLIVMQSAINVCVGGMIWRLTRKLLESKRYTKPYLGAAAAWMLYFVLIGCSPWYLVPYSDSTALWIPILLVLIYIGGSAKWNLMKGLLVGLLGGLAFSLKPQTAIPAIAIVLNEVAALILCRNRKRSLAFLCTLSVGALVFLIPVRGWIVGSVGIELDREGRLGLVHHFCMGLDKERSGQWSGSDGTEAMRYQTNAERDAFEMQKSIDRIQAFGVAGLAEHAVKKCLVNFSDGSFTWKGLSIVNYPSQEKDPVISPLLREIVYEEGAYYPILHTIQQGVWLLVLVLCAVGAFVPRRMIGDGGDALSVIMLSVVGIICCNMLFEASGRYMYVMVPVMIPLAIYVLGALVHKATPEKNG